MSATVRRVLMRWIRTPVSGSASTEPAAMASSTRPRSPGVRRRPCLTCGIRDAHDANANPAPMNAAYVARTAAFTRCGEYATSTTVIGGRRYRRSPAAGRGRVRG